MQEGNTRTGRAPIPLNVRFIPIDFATDDLEETRRGAGYDGTRSALFLWEGVTYYLPMEAVGRSLGVVKSLSAPGSFIAFDYASLSPEALSEEGIKKLREQMSSNQPAEPARFGIPQGKLDLFLGNRGFRVVELLGPEQMEARYLTLRDGSVVGGVPRLLNMVVAQVDKPANA